MSNSRARFIKDLVKVLEGVGFDSQPFVGNGRWGVIIYGFHPRRKEEVKQLVIDTIRNRGLNDLPTIQVRTEKREFYKVVRRKVESTKADGKVVKLFESCIGDAQNG